MYGPVHVMGFTPTGMTRYEAVNDEAPVEGLRKELSRVVVDAGVRFETQRGESRDRRT